MLDRSPDTRFAVFGYPYEALRDVSISRPAALEDLMEPGMALIWRVSGAAGGAPLDPEIDFARHRPFGMALIAVLPPADRLSSAVDVLTLVDRCNPHSVLPFHPEPDPEDLSRVLQRPPEALSVEVSDYLSWRGIRMDGDTRRVVRRIIDLSGELRTVSALARALYVSRRALGRRFLSRGLPSPSHWLQFGRALRAAIRLQTTNDSLFTVASDLGYPDGFALSNQMKRLTGVRPTVARGCLGWEWFLEAWLTKERQEGHLRMGGKPVGVPLLRRVAEPGRGTPEAPEPESSPETRGATDPARSRAGRDTS